MKYLKTLVLTLCSLLCACNPSTTEISAGSLGTQKSTSIYVAQFEGSSQYIDYATDLFVKQLRKRTNRQVIQSPLTNIDREHTEDYKIVPLSEGIAEARKAGAGLLVLGKITGDGAFYTYSINGYATIEMIDVETGKTLATIHRPSGLLFASSQHQCIMAATKRTAKALAGVF